MAERGNELFGQGDYEEAIEAYDESLRLDSENPVTWSNKGTHSSNQRRYDEAIQAFDEVIRIDPELASAWSYKGGALHELGEYDEAIVALDQAIVQRRMARSGALKRVCSLFSGRVR